MTRLLTTALSWFGRSMENPRRPLDPWSQGLSSSLDGSLSAAGVRVNRDKALTCSAFWRGVNLICGTVAKLPLGAYRRMTPGMEYDPRHPASKLLRRRPNEAMTPFAWKWMCMGHILCHGNSYNYIMRRADGQPVELLPLDPEKTYPVRENTELWYVHELGNGEMRKIHPRDMLHLMGHSHNGMEGMSILSKARESLGLAIGMQGFASTFFRNNARPNVVLKHPGRLSPEARKNLRESWERMNAGIDNAHRTAILEEGIEAKELSINAQDAQLLESRQFSLIDVANWLGVPPHKLGSNINVSYSSLEQENQAYLDDSIDPWLVRWEEECEAKLMTSYQQDRDTHCIVYDRFPLVRADLQQRGEYYTKALNGGWMSPDEVRSREGLNPIPSNAGQVYFRPLNLNAIGVDPDGPEGPAVAPGSTLLAVPDLRQEELFDCGTVALQSVASYYNRESTLEPRLEGTTPQEILGELSRIGLASVAKAEMTTADLARFFNAGIPVLCPIQMEDSETAAAGHWVIVIGVGLGQVFIQDPLVGVRMVSEADWLARWFDVDADGNRFDCYGIAVADEMPLIGDPLADVVDETAKEPAEPTTPDEPAQPQPDPVAEQVAEATRAALIASMQRMVRRIGTNARRAATRPGTFLRWLDTIEEDHGQVVADSLRTPLDAFLLARRRNAQPAEPLAQAFCRKISNELLELSGRCKPENFRDAVINHFSLLEKDVSSFFDDLEPGVIA